MIFFVLFLGIGFRVALGLAGRGCKVIIADVVDSEKSVEKIIEWTGNPNITYQNLNLASFASIRKFAEDINKNEKKLHLLINNAGCGVFPSINTDDGCNLGMQVNHFGGFLLTHLLIGNSLLLISNLNIIRTRVSFCCPPKSTFTVYY